MKHIRIGSGAGYAGDRLEPSLDLIRHGQLNYICYECLAERTIAIGQQAKMLDPSKGYNELLEYRMEQALPLCWEHKVKLITNMGAANPEAAVEKTLQIARRKGLSGMKIACVTGDDLLSNIKRYMDKEVWETHAPLRELSGRIVSANAYMGIEGILTALRQGADVVITGRVADPSLFLAPVVHEFGWPPDDWDRLGKGVMMSHLLECAGQLTGGYFAEPGKKDVPGLSNLGFPIAEIGEDGSFTVTKLPEAGGMVTPGTCAEQICYEIHDPANYLTPDVTANFKEVYFEQTAKDTVRAGGGTGTKRTGTLKCSIGYQDCFIGEGELSYGGPGCAARGRLALEILRERLKQAEDGGFEELKFDMIGCNSLYWNPHRPPQQEPAEVRIRAAGRADTKIQADRVGREVEALYTNGPAGGCGAVTRTREIISIASILVDRQDVVPDVQIVEI